VKNDFFKFPSTPHIISLSGSNIREDKVFSKEEREEFLQHVLVIEEKIDGANLGISINVDGKIQVQNRGGYLNLPAPGQWKKLGDWLIPRTEVLFDHLSDKFILFGEWCYARHSVFYDRLPDWFLGFDIYDKQIGRFLSSNRRDNFFRKMSIAQVPFLAHRHLQYTEIQKLLTISKFGNQPAEGLYFRFEQDDWLRQRAKLVRSEFIQDTDKHWSNSALYPNRLNLEIYP